MRYTSTARRDGKTWRVTCDQHPRAQSIATRLDQATEHQREAIAFVTGVPEDEVEVEVRPVIPTKVKTALRASQRLRERAAAANREAASKTREAARELAAAGYSRRDVGNVLGVSHQRADQLIKDDLLSH